jgi:hypothetical protein
MSDHYTNGVNDALYANVGVLPETYVHSGNGRAPKREPWRSYSEVELAGMDIPDPAFDIESLLPSEEGPALFFGPPGACKSWITMHLCRCMATGAPFLGRFATKKYPSVLFINFDAGTKTTMRRFKRLAAGKIPLTNYHLISEREFDAVALRHVFEDNPGAFIVIDCLADFYHADRTKEQGDAMREFIRDLRSLFETHGCNGVVLDHPHRPRDGQPGDFYGSVQKEATFRTMWHAQPMAPTPGDPTGVARVKIVSRKINEGEKSPPFIVKVCFSSAEITFTHEADLTAAGTVAPAIPDFVQVERLLAGVPHPGLTRPTISSYLGFGKERTLLAIRASSKIAPFGKARNSSYYLKESDAAPSDSPNDSESDAAPSDSKSDPEKGEVDDEFAAYRRGREPAEDDEDDPTGGSW